MPIFEYHCGSCGHEFERLMFTGDHPTAQCPQCGAEAQRRLSTVVLRFYGSGWTKPNVRKAGECIGKKTGDGTYD
jgi:putative FmdB family regulatory protein